MPYHLQESDGGFYVVTTSTGRKHSKEPLTKAVAKKQMVALHIHADEKKEKKVKSKST